jgi:general secretion pathway protein D
LIKLLAVAALGTLASACAASIFPLGPDVEPRDTVALPAQQNGQTQADEHSLGAASLGEAAAPQEPFRQVGSAAFLNPNRARYNHTRESADGILLTFENTPIADVVSAVIGDILGAEFVIDPAVNGRVTLRAARPVPRADVPAALDRALRLSGVSLIETADGVYFVAPEARARDFARGPRLAGEGLPPGFGSVIAPLEFVSAREMARLLRPFAPNAAAVQTDEARELLILSGDPAQLEVLLETVALFDVDWLAQMSFSLYPLQVAEPDVLIGEMDRIFGGADGPIGSQLEFVPLERLNAIVVIAKTPRRLTQAEEWLRRLDVRADRGRRVRVVPLVNADAETLAERLNELFSADGGNTASSQVTVQADTDSNALLVIADEDGYDQILDVVARLDRAPDQVMIEVRIVEVVLNDDLRYGVQWFLDTRDGGRATSSGNAGGAVTATFPGFAYTYASDYVRASLSAIASITDVETVSTPQIMVMDNQRSLIQVGDQVPVVTQSAVSIANPDAPIVNSVEFRDTGVVLAVTPRISPDGAVMLEVEQEVSSVAETTTSGIDSPTIQQRRFETTVSVQDGQTVAMGGLIRTTRSQTRSGVPGLQRVPGLGALFSETGDTSRRTELIVFLTPRVIRSSEDAAQATRALGDRLQTLRDRGFGGD